MLIEFCCPACCSPLAVKEDVAGGQVNCPKCQKLILIPSCSLFPKKDGGSLFDPDISYEIETVKRAISISVEPYRRELETKSTLLNEAVEMVKLRNQRIKEVESLLLKVQKDLWQLEVEHEERSSDYVEAQKDRSLLKKKLQEVREQAPDEDLKERCDTLETQILDLKKKNSTTAERLRRTLQSLAGTHMHLKETDKLDSAQKDLLSTWQSLLPDLLQSVQALQKNTQPLQEALPLLQNAAKALADSAHEVQTLREKLRSMEETHQHDQKALRTELKKKFAEALEQIVDPENRT